MSRENREQYETLLASVWKVMAEDIAASRDFTSGQLDGWIDNLEICSPEKAKEHGLVDELWFDDQVREYFCGLCGTEKSKDLKYISLSDYAKARVRTNLRSKDKIAVIYADGEIAMNDHGNGTVGNNFARLISEVRQDPAVKAVVFRVNSPGGSVQASAAIEREIALLKAGKPVVSSFGPYAASGGYWMSCGSDRIFSDRTTLTGSIGVFGLVPSFGKALRKNLHLNVHEISTHKHGSLINGIDPLDAEEAAVMQKQVDDTYVDFITRVSEGRGLPADAVEEIAQGRIWAGADATGIGLVDEFGGLIDAIRYAASSVSLENYRLVEYPKSVPVIDQIMASLNESGTEQDVRAVNETDAIASIGRRLLSLDGPEVAARMPFVKIFF